MRQFEPIFLFRGGEAGRFSARVFGLAGELDFAGHPVIGAACMLHSLETEAGTARWSASDGWSGRLPCQMVNGGVKLGAWKP